MFSDSSEDEAEKNVQLTVNEHYAKAFTYRKEREELEKLKEKYGSDFEESELEESTDSESAESEDEDGEELTPAVDAAILRTLARIRKKDPAIYDSSKSIFGEEAQNVSSQANTLNVGKKEKVKDKSKPVRVRQVNLDAVLHGSRSPSPEPSLPTHVEEQRALRDETIAVFHSAVPEDDDDVDDLLIPREKTQDELVKEEEEYKAFLERQVGEDLRDLISVRGSDGEGEEEKEEGVKEDEGKKKKKKKSKGKGKEDKSKAEKDQEFLMNYILNRGWVDKAAQRLPTYSEITGSKRKGKRKGDDSDSDAMSVTHENQNQNQNEDDAENEDEDDAGLLSDASFESLASHFETSYNHRFEEPDAATIQTFPRNIESAVRRNDSARKEARERRKARKEEELAKKREEVRRLKALKMKEIKRKLEKIGKEGGLLKGKGDDKKRRRDLEDEDGEDEVDETLRELDLEGEWDPEKHDRQMQGLFANLEDGEEGGESGEEGAEEGMRFDEDGKPVWDDDIDIGDIEMSDDDARPVASSSKKDKKDKKKKKKRDEGGLDEGGVDVDEMDADRIAERRFEEDEEEWDGTEEMRKRKWDEYMNELYELDFNDMVAGMPTRFKYTSVPSQNYSLDPVEILLADDQDLNEYMSIKKYAPYRKEKGDRSRWDPRQKDKLRAFRETLRERQKAWGMDVGVGEGGEHGERAEKKKRKGKKERMKAKGLNAGEEDGNGEGDEGEDEGKAEEKPVEKENKEREGKKEKKKKKRKLEDVVDEENDVDEVQAAEDAETSKKKKHRRRHGKKDKAGVGAADEA